MSAFPNHYHRRMVAESDASPCTLCYKPSSTVLVSDNKVDFFYVCPQHLKDELFSSVVAPQEYKELERQKRELEDRVAAKTKRVEELKPKSWNIFSGLLGLAQDGEKEKDGEKATEKTKEKASDPYTVAKEELRELTREMGEADAKIANYVFKDYTLNKDIYKMRTQNYVLSKIRAKKQQEMHSPGFFPSVPQHNVQRSVKKDDDH